jgi:hypothetical protein
MLQHIGVSRSAGIAALVLGLAVAGCDDEGGTTGDEQLGAVPQGPGEVAPPAAVPESDPMIEDPLADEPAQ